MVEITAHRGFWSTATENSLLAFRAALDLGVDWIELDVRLTADDQVVVFHDNDLSRLKSGKVVGEMDWDELVKVDIRSLNRAGSERAERIPRFDEVLQLVSGGARLNVELKYPAGQRDDGRHLVDRVWELVDAREASDFCVLTSFHHAAIRYALRQGIVAGFALDDLSRWSPSGPITSVQHRLIEPAFVEQAKRSGQSIHAWTVNDQSRARELIAMGVDNIITDNAQLMLNLRDARL